MTGRRSREPGFPAEFEAALARLRYAAESAYTYEWSEPDRVASALRAVFEFASSNPKTVLLLTGGALAHGPYGNARYQDLVGAAARVLARCRDELPAGVELPGTTERVLVGGVAMLLSERLRTGPDVEVSHLLPEAVQFVLTPYLGPKRARRVAGDDLTE